MRLDRDTKLKLGRDLIRLSDLMEDADDPDHYRRLKREYDATLYTLFPERRPH